MHRTTIFMMQYFSIIIRITAVLSFINKILKRSNNAEQDNVYDIVNSYNYTETAFKKYIKIGGGGGGRGGGGVNLVIVHSRTMFLMWQVQHYTQQTK